MNKRKQGHRGLRRHRRVLRAARRVAAPLRAMELGQSMVEYAIIIALIAVVAMVAIQLLGGGIAQVFQNILGKIQGLGR